MESNALKLPSRRILVNGLLSKFIREKNGPVIQLKNTCAFDSIAQILANGYIQYEKYRDNVSNCDNALIAASRSLAVEGAVHETYQLRLQALKAVVTPSEKNETIPLSGRTRSKKLSVQPVIYDCESCPIDTARDLLQGIDSVSVKYSCSLDPDKPCMNAANYTIIFPDLTILSTNGLSKLDAAVLVSLGLANAADDTLPSTKIITGQACPAPCNGETTVDISFGPHLVISVDHFGANERFQPLTQEMPLDSIPSQIRLCGVKFVLSGLIARQVNHFVAYTRISTGAWELQNDLSKTVQPREGTSSVSPVLLVYIKMC